MNSSTSRNHNHNRNSQIPCQPSQLLLWRKLSQFHPQALPPLQLRLLLSIRDFLHRLRLLYKHVHRISLKHLKNHRPLRFPPRHRLPKLLPAHVHSLFISLIGIGRRLLKRLIESSDEEEEGDEYVPKNEKSEEEDDEEINLAMEEETSEDEPIARTFSCTFHFIA